jgi:DNA polymerase-3 subunit epsilon
MRQIVLDTETTGLNPKLGDRVIEIGCVELVSRRPSGNHFHRYLNPEREIEEGALRVHGITNEFLQDKPRFADVAREFLEYVSGAELVIHNAAFDIEFLNMELAALDMGPVERHIAGVVDTLRQARELHPGKKNTLDALCERYAVEHSHRTLHGALLDAQLLAEVYLAMTRGQESLAIGLETVADAAAVAARVVTGDRPPLIVVRAGADELADHVRVLEAIARESKGRLVWRDDPAAAQAA